jgi:hypothetical protein
VSRLSGFEMTNVLITRMIRGSFLLTSVVVSSVELYVVARRRIFVRLSIGDWY